MNIQTPEKVGTAIFVQHFHINRENFYFSFCNSEINLKQPYKKSANGIFFLSEEHYEWSLSLVKA